MDKTRAILPLTIGLATSAMIRWNHAFLMPEGAGAISMMFGMDTVLERAQEALPRIMELHRAALAGTCPDRQILEEFDGTGFYSVDNDAGYEEALARYPQAHAFVSDALERMKEDGNV